VPYISFRCGDDYECNVYGDLDHPAGVELGVYRNLLQNQAAKSNCASFIEAVLPRPSDKSAVALLDENYKIVKHGDLTFELTLPADEDSYGGWWISVYYQSHLNAARASESEMKNISVPKAPNTSVEEADSSQITPAKPNSAPGDLKASFAPTNWTFTNLEGHIYSNTVFSSATPIAIIVLVNGLPYRVFFTNLPPEVRAVFHYDQAKADAFLDQQASQRQTYAEWSSQELKKAREKESDLQFSESPQMSGMPFMSGGGNVYVRGYERKDGTYVNAYSRRR
jgi:hypothetical protein